MQVIALCGIGQLHIDLYIFVLGLLIGRVGKYETVAHLGCPLVLSGFKIAPLLTDAYRRFLMEESAKMPGAPGRHQRDMIVRFYCHAIMGMPGDWVRLGMKQDVREALEIIRTAVNKNIFRAE